MSGIHFSHRNGTVTVTADDGTSQMFDMAAFLADEAGCIASVGNGITPVDSRTDAEKQLDDLKAQVDQLTQALKDKGALTDAEIAAAVVVDVKG